MSHSRSGPATSQAQATLLRHASGSKMVPHKGDAPEKARKEVPQRVRSRHPHISTYCSLFMSSGLRSRPWGSLKETKVETAES